MLCYSGEKNNRYIRIFDSLELLLNQNESLIIYFDNKMLCYSGEKNNRYIRIFDSLELLLNQNESLIIYILLVLYFTII